MYEWKFVKYNYSKQRNLKQLKIMFVKLKTLIGFRARELIPIE